jgi:DNA-binding transcriptional ArsR family regulator
MVDNMSDVLDDTFAALSDPTRRALLVRLADGESTVTELAIPFEMSLQAVSKHLKVLGRAGLVQQTRDGRIQRCRIEAAPLREALTWIERYRRFWDDRLGALAEYLTEDETDR